VKELIRAVEAANVMLADVGLPLIRADCLGAAALIGAAHDYPSLRWPLPLVPDSGSGRGLSVFIEADGITMIEYGEGLKSETPLGPMVEPWRKGKVLDVETVGKQVVSSVKSLRLRLAAAFEMASAPPLLDCFRNQVLRVLAGSYLESWSAELGVDLSGAAGSS
jgi:hypothetical protein